MGIGVSKAYSLDEFEGEHYYMERVDNEVLEEALRDCLKENSLNRDFDQIFEEELECRWRIRVLAGETRQSV